MKKQFDHRFLLHAFRLRHVRRFAICQCLMPDTVANHSWFTAILAYYICEKMRYPYVLLNEVILCSLLHDFSESITSDVPFFVKRHAGIQDGIKDLENVIVESVTDDPFIKENLGRSTNHPVEFTKFLAEICDLLDGIIYLEHEKILGNRHQWVEGVRKSMEDLVLSKLGKNTKDKRLKLLVLDVLENVSRWASFRHDSGVGISYDKLAKKVVVSQSNRGQNSGNSAVNSRRTKRRVGDKKKRRIKKS